MIHGNITVTVTKGVSSINDKIILYRGDRKVEVIFEILQSAFKFSKGENVIMTTKASYGQLIIDKPDETFIFSDLSQCEDGKVKFTITGDMIDELTEVGLYSIQIRLFDETRASRITIPPVADAIEIREPMAEEIGDDIVGDGIVGDTTIEDEGTTEETFDENGAYNLTTWYTGDKITESKLNKIEDAIYTVNEKIENSNISDTSEFITESELEAKGYLTEHQSLEGYATETYVDEAVANVEVDLSDYATKEYVNGAVDNVEVDLTGYATEEFVNDAVGKIGTINNDNLVVNNSISLGNNSTATGQYSYAGGFRATASGKYSHAEGGASKASGDASHAEGYCTIASSNYQHVQGRNNIEDSSNTYAHIVGNGTMPTSAGRSNAHTLDWSGNAWFAGKVTADGTPENDNDLTTKAYVDNALNNVEVDLTGYATEEYVNDAISDIEVDVDLSAYAPINSPNFTTSVSMGRKDDTTVGANSTALGSNVTASGSTSYAEGESTTASGVYSHAEGYHTTASGDKSHAEGQNTTASNDASHAEGYNTKASGMYSHAEGAHGTASGVFSHAEGAGCAAKGSSSHAEGYFTTASGDKSHAEGDSTLASSSHQHVQGKFNIEDKANTYAHIVGNGESTSVRSNAHTLDWSGNAWFAGKVTVGADNKVLATQEYVDEAVANVEDCKIQVIGNGEETYILTPDDVEADITALWILNNVSIGGNTYNNDGELFMIETWIAEEHKVILLASIYGYYVVYRENDNGEFELTEEEWYAVMSDIEEINERLNNIDLSNYATTNYVDEECQNILLNVESTLSSYATTSSVNNKLKSYATTEYVDEAVANVEVDLTGYATEEYVDEAVNNIDVSNLEVDLSDYAPIDSPNFTTAISMGRKADTTIGANSTALGNNVTASSLYSHAEGSGTTASGGVSHAEGAGTTASGMYSHAEGEYTTASGEAAHAEGNWTRASGGVSHAEGNGTTASGRYSHAEGDSTLASSSHQHVQGKFNIEDKANTYAHIVGNGTGTSARSNAHTLDWDGNAWFAGKVTAEGTPENDNDLTTKKYVDSFTGGFSIWVGTQEEYDAISDKLDTTLYFIKEV